jgi:hypothetical protein
MSVNKFFRMSVSITRETKSVTIRVQAVCI